MLLCLLLNVVQKLSRLFKDFFSFLWQEIRRARKTGFGSRTKTKTTTLWPASYTVAWNIILQVIQQLNYMLTTCCRVIGVFLGYLCAGTRITSTYTAAIKTSFTVHSVITANNLQMFEVRLSAWVRIV